MRYQDSGSIIMVLGRQIRVFFGGVRQQVHQSTIVVNSSKIHVKKQQEPLACIFSLHHSHNHHFGGPTILNTSYGPTNSL